MAASWGLTPPSRGLACGQPLTSNVRLHQMRRLLLVAAVTFTLSAVVTFTTAPPLVDLKITAVLADLGLLRQAMETGRRRGLPLPDEFKGLSALLDSPAMLEQLPKDKWGAEYLYRRVEAAPGYVIYSAGRNGVDEQGGGDDITDERKPYSCEEYGINCPMKADEIAFTTASALTLLSALTIVAIFGGLVVRWVWKPNAA